MSGPNNGRSQCLGMSRVAAQLAAAPRRMKVSVTTFVGIRGSLQNLAKVSLTAGAFISLPYHVPPRGPQEREHPAWGHVYVSADTCAAAVRVGLGNPGGLIQWTIGLQR